MASFPAHFRCCGAHCADADECTAAVMELDLHGVRAGWPQADAALGRRPGAGWMPGVLHACPLHPARLQATAVASGPPVRRRRCRVEAVVASASCWSRHTLGRRRPRTRWSAAEKSGDGLSTSSLQETAALDQLLDLLMGAQSPQALAQLVAENIMALDQKFWIRLAARTDLAGSSRDEKER